jgi:hypothetical protein
MQRRRLFFAAVLPFASATPAWAEQTQAEESDSQSHQTPRYNVSTEQLQRAVAERFPLRYPVAGLLNLDVQVPQLRLLPAQNRLGAEMAVNAAGPALQRSHQGTLEVEFALRYEARDRTIRAHQLRLKRMLFPTLPPNTAALLNTYGPTLAEQTLLEVVVHRLRPQDLALADVMNMLPGSITVTEQGLVMGFVEK